MDPMVAAHLEMAKFKEEKMAFHSSYELGIWVKWVEERLNRLDKVEKLVEALCTVLASRSTDNDNYKRAWDILVKHSRIPLLKAELAELEGKR